MNDDKVILVIDDSPDTLEIIERNLVTRGYKLITATSADDGLSLLEHSRIDLVITDLKMPKVGGLEVVQHIKENFSDIEVMVITGYATLSGAVEAVKLGAEEYLAKPFTEDELNAAVERALFKLEKRRSFNQTDYYTDVFHGLYGQSSGMHKVYNMIRQVAPTPATVLITGESGTGKELIARAIHYSSPRVAEPFVTINCGAIPENLLESELFGYVKGAFTGADKSRAGFFQTADNGTIFLDEISETSLSMQVKLLRALQEKEIRMLGSSKNIPVDVRIISATNKNLEKLIENNLFREDLYYRLNVISINVPPLRSRKEDITILARIFLEKFSESFGKPPVSLSERADHALRHYNWPGNVRELENLMQRLVILSGGSVIDVIDLPENMHFSARYGTGEFKSLEEIENEHILFILKHTGDNKTRAAKILGIDRKTLREKIQRMTPQD
ncbi:MAG: sigma-54-dependent Fis family transcriptional regulator [Spirochaetaceae bacterium]|nr:sigma-54-dependent Fis family transcriptional regulator [Spirochaetaceae bacterium]RKX76406.1 MAG: sigma-54-dependent Fis family transcriptional regulator [Spirochaetota bacterium]RKX89298.1 MAG: sigma-54-dependent Fis family transcriptional regulator [Spirochaetota bacterium]RKX98866.1 MAG: sigma-54-dependent Fis family transcriptional regulator [Spirochaetota bacterium]